MKIKFGKNGFTLIELSIVLVIIGLLIGGILVGQSLILSAQVHKAVKEIEFYQYTFSSFKNRFRAWPGDYTDPNDYFPSAGNGDGLIAWVDEGFNAWHDLGVFQYLDESYTGFYVGSTYRVREGVNAPKCNFCDIDEAAIHFTSTSTKFQFGGGNVGSATYNRAVAITSEKSAMIDAKIDDGLPKSGIIMIDGAQSTGCSTTPYSNTAENLYDFDSSGPECVLQYNFSSGDYLN